MKEHELFILKQKAVIRMYKMLEDDSLSSFFPLIKAEKSMVMDTKHDPMWLDDDSSAISIRGLL